MNYIKRVCDDELQNKLSVFGAVHITGPKWCGKTTTAKQLAQSYIEMQDPDKRDSYIYTAQIKPSNLLMGKNPRLIDEWQIAPNLWDAVNMPKRFFQRLLNGSLKKIFLEKEEDSTHI